LRPLLASLSFFATPWLFSSASARFGFGERTPYTVGICAATIVFAVSALASLVQALRRLGQPLPAIVRLHRLLVAVAATSAAAFLFAYGIIGIRLWRY